MKKKRVLVGMSGGVDSTAACMMLQEEGYEVFGATLRTYDDLPSDVLPPSIMEAKTLADRLHIPHYVPDVRDEFRRTVVQYFIDEYMGGRTPNPCVVCNPSIKFKVLCDVADELGCDYIATGHYSQLVDLDGHLYVVAGDDEKKDQSYFLWRLPQTVLRRCLFPLGRLTKPEVRAYLAAHGLTEKAADGESMEVCFVKGDYRNFLREQVPDMDNRIGRGKFVDAEGKVIGEHRGFPYYTIGQRKGLEIALGHPVYVLKLNAQKNTVMIGDEELLKSGYVLVEQLLWTDAAKAPFETPLSVCIRYHNHPVECDMPKQVTPELWLVKLHSMVQAVSPGQSAVFYVGRRVIGGAFIASQRGIAQWIQ